MAVRNDFYLSPSLDWAKRKTRQFTWRHRAEGVAGGVFWLIIAIISWLFG